ncbi:PRC-barrel domain-containing protein [Flavisolibacter nicotianae]|uniref:PRC-barrel domain-containing protein n=1 Tax=Flavisolibacter nicotianae TaxID=2364882 RepID=UPI0013C4010A|nr:PRC-barrel domain-containing protein [Flavisolibacter nicotianae]
MDTMKHRRLQELDHSDFELVKGDPDIRGWDVKNVTGQKIGEVEELIVDAQKKKVRYMVVDLDDNELKLEHRKVLIPIGLAELHKEDDDVLLPAVTIDQLGALPAYDKDSLDEETERRVCNSLGRDTQALASRIMAAEERPQVAKTAEHDKAPATSQDDFYQHDYFHDDNLYKHRLHETTAAKTKEESEYEKGLRLWEMRSEGGIIAGSEAKQKEREVNEEAHLEKVRNRRKSYEERRGYPERERQRDETDYRKDNTIIGRIRDEGLRDA